MQKTAAIIEVNFHITAKSNQVLKDIFSFFYKSQPKAELQNVNQNLIRSKEI